MKVAIICQNCNVLINSLSCPGCGRPLNYFNKWEAVCRCKRKHKKSGRLENGRFYRVSQIAMECKCGSSNLYFKKK